MGTLFSLLRRLPLIWVLFAGAMIAPLATWGYDVPTQATTAGGGVSGLTFGYDSALTPPAIENANRVVWTGGIFFDFAKFLAAETVAPSSRALGRALEAAGFERQAGEAAHHIVAGGAEAAAPARAVLERFEIGINDAANGVFLPGTRAAPNAVGAAVHSPLHTPGYYQAVNEALGQATTRQEALEVLQALRQSLLGGGL